MEEREVLYINPAHIVKFSYKINKTGMYWQQVVMELSDGTKEVYDLPSEESMHILINSLKFVRIK